MAGFLPFRMTRLLAPLLFVALHAFGQNPEVNRYLAEARKALAVKDYPAAYDALMKAHVFHPYHQAILYNLGVMSAATGRLDESIPYLRKALYVNAGYNLEIGELSSVRDRPDFKALLELQKQLQTPVIQSDTALVLSDRTLHIESVDVDPSSGTFYLGSIHRRKVVAVDNRGTVSDFTSPSASMTAVFGVRVDAKRKLLWTCSSPVEEMEGYDSLAKSTVSRFDLKSGKLQRQYSPSVKTRHVLGDLALNSIGEVFVSDSRNNVIFKVNEKTGLLDLFFESADFWNLQGLAFSPDDRYLFISDYIKGPYRLDIKTRTLIKLNSTVEASLKGIDGLTFYGGSLLALQNGTTPFRATRYVLNPTLDTIIGAVILDQAHPAMNEPTIGTVVGDDFYYVANSQWSGYDEQHRLKPSSVLRDIVILKARLK